MGLRILHVVRSLRAETGGLAEAVLRLSGALCAQGHTVSILSLDGGDAARAGNPAVIVLAGRPHGYGYHPDYVPWLREHRREFDGVVLHGLWQYQGFGGWRALAGTDTPYWVYCHGMLDPWFKRTFPLKHLKKWLYWPWGEYRVLRDAKAVLFTCEEERLRARRSFWLYRCREVVTGLGTDAPPEDAAGQREAFLSAVPGVGGRRYLLFLGRLHLKKGCDLLIEAFAAEAREADVDLVMAGPDQCAMRDAWMARARELGVGGRIHWPGMLEGAAKWGAFRGAEAFVLPSHQENFGMTVAEALSCGTPVLISREVNIWREVLADGAGLAEEDTLAGTRRLLTQWLGLSGPERAQMRVCALESFSRRFEAGPPARALAGLFL